MENSAPKPAVIKEQKPGLIVAVKGLAHELFGQLLTARFWKDVFIFTAKTAIRVGGEMAAVAVGHAIVEIGRKFGRGGGAEVDAVKAQFQHVMPQAGVAPSPAAAAFSRGFSPAGMHAPVPVMPDAGPWPGISPGFGGR